MPFEHLPRVCMSYCAHFCFSMYLAKEFSIAALCAVVHAFYPDALVTHSTDTVARLRQILADAGCNDKL